MVFLYLATYPPGIEDDLESKRKMEIKNLIVKGEREKAKYVAEIGVEPCTDVFLYQKAKRAFLLIQKFSI